MTTEASGELSVYGRHPVGPADWSGEALSGRRVSIAVDLLAAADAMERSWFAFH
jgi:hypothetical protein